MGDYGATIAAWRIYNPLPPDPREDRYGVRPTPTGQFADKYPIGVAMLQSPFFALAHVYCLISGQYPSDGFSPPYLFVVGFSSLFYAVWGLWLMLQALRPYFRDEHIRLVTASVIGLATNLVYSSTYTVGMSHPYLFFLYALLLLGIVKLYEQPTLLRAAWVGGAAGMIALTRTPEVICVLIPLLWGVQRWRDVLGRFRFLRQHRTALGVAMLTFMLLLLPQAFYWKFVSGQWWYYGYQGETFNWSDPHILDGLFHFRNGWLIYTPVMAFSLLGLFWLRRRAAADALLPIVFFLLLHWYIIYSWWCWFYINGFGSRPMIETYPLLAFPLAAFTEMMWRKRWSKVVWTSATIFFIWLNLFQTWQAGQGIMWSEKGSWAYYKAIFAKTQPSLNAVIAFDSGESQPNMIRHGWEKWLHRSGHDTLKMVKILAVNAMEDSTETLFTRQMRHSGQFGFRCDGEFSPGCQIEGDTAGVRSGDWLRVSVYAYVHSNEIMYNRDKLATLVVHIFDKEGNLVKYRSTSVTSKVGNEKGSIWHTAAPDIWGEASFFVRVPKNFKPAEHRIKTYVWNPNRQRFFVDDMKVELWRYE
jgi:hypothetical protein